MDSTHRMTGFRKLNLMEGYRQVSIVTENIVATVSRAHLRLSEVIGISFELNNVIQKFQNFVDSVARDSDSFLSATMIH